MGSAAALTTSRWLMQLVVLLQSLSSLPAQIPLPRVWARPPSASKSSKNPKRKSAHCRRHSPTAPSPFARGKPFIFKTTASTPRATSGPSATAVPPPSLSRAKPTIPPAPTTSRSLPETNATALTRLLSRCTSSPPTCRKSTARAPSARARRSRTAPTSVAAPTRGCSPAATTSSMAVAQRTISSPSNGWQGRRVPSRSASVAVPERSAPCPTSCPSPSSATTCRFKGRRRFARAAPKNTTSPTTLARASTGRCSAAAPSPTGKARSASPSTGSAAPTSATRSGSSSSSTTATSAAPGVTR